MGWLWGIVGVALFLVLLFCLPVSIQILFDGETRLAVGLPGLYFPILPKKVRRVNPNKYSLKKYRRLLEKDRLAEEKKQQKKAQKTKNKKAASEQKSIESAKKLPPEPPSDEPSVIRLILPLVGGILNQFVGKIRVRLLRLDIRVGGSDAAQIALMHGAISQGVAYLLTLISQKTKYSQSRKTHISVTPDFLLAKTQADIQIIFRLRLIDLVSTALSFLIRFLKKKAEYASAATPNPVKKEAQT